MNMRWLLCLSVCTLLTRPLAGADYKSPLGFVGSVPSGWLLITASGIRDEPDLFDKALARLRKDDPKRAQLLKDMILNGEQDVILRAESAEVDFVDNINIIGASGNLPTDENETANFCKALREKLSSSEGREPFKACEAKPAGSNFAVFLEPEALTPGTTVLQYLIQCPPGVILAVTAVSKTASLLAVRRDLDLFVNSIRCSS